MIKCVASLVVLACVTSTASAKESFVWTEFHMKLATVRHDGIRPEYIDGILGDCARLGALREAEPTVSTDKVREAREICMVGVTTYVQRCATAPADQCFGLDAAKLATSIGKLAPLTDAERALFDQIPDPFWIDLETFRSPFPGESFDVCLKAGRKQAARPAPPQLRDFGRQQCERAANAFAAECLTKPKRCTMSWEGWEDARTAALALGSTSTEVFDRILASPELAEHRTQEKFDAIRKLREDKKIEACEEVARMRELLGDPTPEMIARVEEAAKRDARSGAEYREAAYLWQINQFYISARSVLETPVEYQTVERAKQAVEQLTCAGSYRDAPTLLEKAKANEQAVTAFQAKEAACMANDACHAKRIAGQICSALKARRDVERDIHKEWGYAKDAGVVDVRRLGGDKNALEALDEEIAAAKEKYRELAKRPFSPASCR